MTPPDIVVHTVSVDDTGMIFTVAASHSSQSVIGRFRIFGPAPSIDDSHDQLRFQAFCAGVMRMFDESACPLGPRTERLR
jgi:hypothetical protein